MQTRCILHNILNYLYLLVSFFFPFLLPQEFPDPSQHVSGFNNAMSGMFEMSHKLAMRILEAIGLGLNLEVSCSKQFDIDFKYIKEK